MLRAGLKPDYISYVAVLSTCSHSGLVQEGKSYFDMMKRVAERGILSPITPRSSGIKASLYADDAAMFVKPTKHDLDALKEILDMFGQVSGLHTNLQKTDVFPICCSEQHLEEIVDVFPAKTGAFPCRYLGLPLHINSARWTSCLFLTRWEENSQDGTES
jgi:pentatricopeptide repeat protein